jgi:hypothetical protein
MQTDNQLQNFLIILRHRFQEYVQILCDISRYNHYFPQTQITAEFVIIYRSIIICIPVNI